MLGTAAAPAGTRVTVASRSRDDDFASYLAAREQALLRTAYALTGNVHDAQDLLQTALAKLYLAWDSVRDREALDGYVRRIMVNENTSLWRRAWKRREHVSDDLPEQPVTDHRDDGTSAQLWEFVQTLPRRQRAVVVLRYYEQLSEAETADVLGVSIGTVKSQTSRALAALRERAPQSLREGER
ncbi:MAG: Sigma-70, region 4 type 2 [uncultured Nocardioides sp.]|uniref:Sigma-70, region 4 type 2 n=1 Tax=uncultured Nocardioides sp. TaxID=198441 RepID=A0A6J4N417_9ACTN|nr:MAG: Sigma-70, region 4 type 2 [uncultured Nocardioides sp.]